MDILRTYFESMIQAIRINEWVIAEEVTYRQIDESSAYIRGELYLNGGFVLHMAEYVIAMGQQAAVEKYRYHLQDANQRRVVRWDNAPHHPEVETHPDHCHRSGDLVEPSQAITLPLVLERLGTVLGNEI